MAKVRDYAKLAADIKEQVGESNIVSAAHCATRLRLVLKESPSAEVTQRISEMPAVIQVVEKGGQYQIVIGTHAKDVYEELTKIMTIDESAQAEVKQGVFARIIATMSAVFAPFVYILAAAGLVQGCLIIITQFAPAFAETGTYAVLSFISWTPSTFLPVMIAVTASKHFKCNTYIAMWCCLALVNADWGAIAARIASGERVKFLIFNMAQTTYTSTVLPPLFLVLVLAYLERFLDKHLPDVLKAIGTPFVCAVVMVPLTILIIGPITDMIANGIAAGYKFLSDTVPMIAGALVGGIWEVFVIFGVHWGVTPMNIANFNNNGHDTFQRRSGESPPDPPSARPTQKRRSRRWWPESRSITPILTARICKFEEDDKWPVLARNIPISARWRRSRRARFPFTRASRSASAAW